MSYTPTVWKNGQTRLNESNLNHLEGQHAAAVADLAVNARRGALVPVATRTSLSYMRSKSPGTATQETSRLSHIITADCTSLRVFYGNITSNGGSGSPVDGDNPIVVRCDVEAADGRRRRGWSPMGGRSVTIEPGGTAYFDVHGVFKKGDRIFTRTNVSVASAGQTWPRGMTANIGPQQAIGEGVTVGADLTLPSTTEVTRVFTYVYSPAMILGDLVEPAPTVALIGDSITAAQGDGTDQGFGARALNNTIGYVALAQPGETAARFVSTDEGNARAFALAHVTHAICAYGVNDIYGSGSTLAAWQANCLTIWTALARRGIKVFQTTLTPKSASTDSWASTSAQTADPATPVRNNANDWIRAGAPIDATTKAAVAVGTAGALVAGQSGHPLAGYFEVADQVESGRNTGLWMVNGTANYATVDGTHPSTAGHAFMALGVDAKRITL